MQRVLAQRPFEEVVSRGAAREPDAFQLEEVGELRDIDVRPFGVERRHRGHALDAERRHPVVELRVAAVQRRGGVGDLHLLGHPEDRAAKVAEPIRVDAGDRRDEVALQLAADARLPVRQLLLEEVKRTGEIADADDREVVVSEPDPLLDREIDLRLDAVDLLGPLPHVHDARQLRLRAVGLQVDAVEDDRAVDDAEGRRHVRAHRHVALNRDGAVREARLPAILVRRPRDRDVEVARDRAPRRPVVLVRELPA